MPAGAQGLRLWAAEAGEGCPAPGRGLCWLQGWADRAPGPAVCAPGLGISFVLHQPRSGLGSSIIPAQCSQLISKGICLLRPSSGIVSAHCIPSERATRLGCAQWAQPQLNCLMGLDCTFCFLMWK